MARKKLFYKNHFEIKEGKRKMGIFKKKATIEELMEAAKELTDEEKAVLIESLSGGEPPKETPDMCRLILRKSRHTEYPVLSPESV